MRKNPLIASLDLATHLGKAMVKEGLSFRKIQIFLYHSKLISYVLTACLIVLATSTLFQRYRIFFLSVYLLKSISKISCHCHDFWILYHSPLFQSKGKNCDAYLCSLYVNCGILLKSNHVVSQASTTIQTRPIPNLCVLNKILTIKRNF